MQKFSNHAIGAALILCAAFANAQAGVVSATAEASLKFQLPELHAQAIQGQRLDTIAPLLLPVATSGADRSHSVAASNDRTHPVGMLVAAIAVMGVVARRRWQQRS